MKYNDIVGMGGGTQSRDSGSSGTVAYHRHCQATILPAYGTENGNGLSWGIIQGLKDELTNLDKVAPGWLDKFRGNTQNITQDLAGLLQVTNQVAEHVYKHSFTIALQATDKWGVKQTLKDKSGDNLWEHVFRPGEDENCSYTYPIGRNVSLTLNGKAFSFNTALQTSGETLSMTFPTNKVKFTKNLQTWDAVSVWMEVPNWPKDKDAYNLDFSHDYCRIPGANATLDGIVPDKNHHAYFIESTKDVNPQIDLTNYVQANWDSEDPSPDVVTFEVHVRSTKGSKENPKIADRINLWQENGEHKFPLKNAGNSTWNWTYLTDQFYVDPYRVNVYVFRFHPRWHEVSVSLAYVYGGPMATN